MLRFPQIAVESGQRNTGKKFVTQSSITEGPRIPFPRPVSGIRQTLNDRATTTARSVNFQKFEAFPGNRDFTSVQRPRGNIAKNVGSEFSTNRNNGKLIVPDKCNAEFHITRIFGGVETSIGEFPWMALLEYDKGKGFELRCTGSLISNWHVLTAAHCVHEWDLSKLGLTLRSVRLGEWDTRTNPDCVEETVYPTLQSQKCATKYISVPVQKVYIHPSFNPRSFSNYNDIALLQLRKPVQFNDYVRPICLPKNREIGPWATATGWGRTENALRSEKLLKVDLPFVDKKICEPFYRKKYVELSDRQICFGERGKDSCAGDSGGPLIQTDESHPRESFVHIIGIVSLGPVECGSPEGSGVYTKVYEYLPWIYEQMGFMNESQFKSSARFRLNPLPEFDAGSGLIFPSN
ncbi:hypothetical protein QAD02_011973 [Eretmocerus hayati]|uniref:Uncharacterized protein n=1 Tax=Eretmocerus hayati TaxID=131215 RepID=A0ACC2NYJ4_9HYME|nr:hypothetical protein QAD02_011973 [Eretmocerus hayati]